LGSKDIGLRLSIIIPTIGRSLLKRTLESIGSQELMLGDEVLVAGDGTQTGAEEMFHASKLPGVYISLRSSLGKLGPGHTVRNAVMPRATGDYLLYMDDDDWYLPGAFAVIRNALLENPGKPHLFRMRRLGKKDVLWKNVR